MHRRLWIAAALAVATLASACEPGLLPGGVGDVEQRLGPEYRFGPIEVVNAEGEVVGRHAELVWFRVAGGHCTQVGDGRSCSLGGAPVPTSFDDAGVFIGDGRTCINGVTGLDIAAIRAQLDGAATVELEPLAGPADAPVNAFGVCWAREVDDPDLVDVWAFDGDGNEVIGVRPRTGPPPPAPSS